MAHDDAYPMRLLRRPGKPAWSEAAQEAIYATVQLLKTRHEVAENAAFLMLVQASVDSQTSVRETASRMLAAVPAIR